MRISQPLIFVVGVGRSGTSLLQSMFAAHPAVAYMPETGFLRRHLAAGYLNSLQTAGGEAAVIQRLLEDKTFGRLGLDIMLMVERAIESGGRLDKAIYNEMVNSYQVDGITWVGDKDPRLIEFLPLISVLFSDVAIINIIRDPRDILLSKKRAAWSSKGHVWKHIFANRVQLQLGRFWGQRLFGTNYHEVLYEELIASPHEVLFRLCDQIGLPFDKSMLSFSEAAKKLVSDGELSWKKETFGPLLTENKGKFRAGLLRKEIVLTEMCCKESFLVGGYIREKSSNPLSWRDKVWVMAGLVLIFAADWPYRFYRNFRVHQACKKVS